MTAMAQTMPPLDRQEARLGWRLVAPSLLIIGLLVFYPIVFNVYLSFFDVNIGRENRFVGLQNYTTLLRDGDFYHSVGTTAWFLLGSVAGTTLLGLGVALMMNKPFPLRGLVRGLILLPYIAPVISVVFSWQFFFDPVNGYYNYLMVDLFGVLDQRVNLIGDSKNALVVVILFDIWKNFPFAYLMLLSRLQSINKSMYEAAELDGANGWQQFWHVTVPELRFVFGTIVLLRFIWNMNKFDEVYLLSPSVKTLPVYTYFMAFVGNIEQGMAAAISIVQFGLLLVLIVYYVKKVLKW